MITRNRIKTVLTLAAVAMAFLGLATTSANAATMSASPTAPDIGSLDIANYTGTSLDKWFCYPGEYASRPAGQTFTTGESVKFNAITYKIDDTTHAAPEKGYTIRVCTVDRVNPGDTTTWVLTEIHSETATQDFEWDLGEFMTWTLDEPVLLAANTEYGIDVGMNYTTSHWSQGIPYLLYGGDEYAGGTRYHTGHRDVQSEVLAGVGDESMVNVSGDRYFHIDLSTADSNAPTVYAGADMISWSGQAVTMDANVVNNDTNEPQGTLTYLWTADAASVADPNLDVAITGADTEDATVTITKTAPTGDATVVTMTLAVTLEGKDPVTDTMTIDVYDDSCLAAKAAGPVEIDPTDIDGNCITNFADFAVLAITWLDDYTLTEPVAK